MAGGRTGIAHLRGPGFLKGNDLKQALSEQARRLGFDCIGVTVPDAIPQATQHFRDFLSSGAHGDMDWLAERPERRADPRGLWPDVRSVIMLGVNYGPDEDPLAILTQRTRGAILDASEDANTASKILVTVHPSFLLRMPEEDKRAAYARFVADLKLAAPFV